MVWQMLALCRIWVKLSIMLSLISTLCSMTISRLADVSVLDHNALLYVVGSTDGDIANKLYLDREG